MSHFITKKERSEVKKLFLVQESLAERVIGIVRFLAFGWFGTLAVMQAFRNRSGLVELILPVAVIGSICIILLIFSLIAAKRSLRTGRYARAMKYLTVTADVAVIAYLAHTGLGFIRGFSPDLDLVLVVLIYTACFMFAASSYLFLALFRFHALAVLYAGVLFVILYAVIPFFNPFLFTLLRDPLLFGKKIQYLILFAGMFAADVGLALLLAVRCRRIILSGNARERLARFLPETVDRELLTRGQDIPEAGARCRATVLSVVVEGFGAQADSMKPEDTVSLLNTVFNEMIEAVFAREGALGPLTGDGLKAVFGTPLKTVEPEANAVRAAIEMLRKVESLNTLRRHRRLPLIKLGVGIHTGDLTVGSIGGERRADFTAVGDTVDTAAKLEQYTRTAAGRIIVSETTRARLGNEFSIQLLGKATLKGKTQALKLYAINPWLTPVKVDETSQNDKAKTK